MGETKYNIYIYINISNGMNMVIQCDRSSTDIVWDVVIVSQ